MTKENKKDEPLMGDNSGVTGERILGYIERIERLEAEKKIIAEDIKEIYGEAKAFGFDAPTIRKIVTARKTNKEKRAEQLSLFDLYTSAIGMEA